MLGENHPFPLPLSPSLRLASQVFGSGSPPPDDPQRRRILVTIMKIVGATATAAANDDDNDVIDDFSVVHSLRESRMQSAPSLARRADVCLSPRRKVPGSEGGREGQVDGRRIGETGPPPSIVGDEDGEGRRHSGRHGTAEDDDGRADRGQGCASSCSAMNPVRASEAAALLSALLALSPWPGPGRALLALLLGPGPLLGLGLPPVCVRTFVHRPHSTRERPEQSREEKTTFAACWLLLLLQPPACVSPCRPTVTLYTSFMEDMLIFFFV